MIPFHLQIDLTGRRTTLMVEQMDQLADNGGFIRYQIKTFNQQSVVFVNIEEETVSPEGLIGFSEDDGFTSDQITVISAAIRDYNSTRKPGTDQIAFDF